MGRLVRRAAAILGMAMIPTVALAGSALAHDQYGNWSSNDYTGYCSTQSGGYLVAVQQYARSYGSYSGAVDAAWGSGSDAGLKALQRYYSIPADGCAGPQTWSNMQSSLTALCSPGYVCNGPSARVYLGREYQYFDHRSGCTWTSYTNNNPVGGPVRQYTYYRFGFALGGAICQA